MAARRIGRPGQRKSGRLLRPVPQQMVALHRFRNKVKYLSPVWRAHSCVPRRDSSRRLPSSWRHIGKIKRRLIVSHDKSVSHRFKSLLKSCPNRRPPINADERGLKTNYLSEFICVHPRPEVYFQQPLEPVSSFYLQIQSVETSLDAARTSA